MVMEGVLKKQALNLAEGAVSAIPWSVKRGESLIEKSARLNVLNASLLVATEASCFTMRLLRSRRVSWDF